MSGASIIRSGRGGGGVVHPLVPASLRSALVGRGGGSPGVLGPGARASGLVAPVLAPPRAVTYRAAGGASTAPGAFAASGGARPGGFSLGARAPSFPGATVTSFGPSVLGAGGTGGAVASSPAGTGASFALGLPMASAPSAPSSDGGGGGSSDAGGGDGGGDAGDVGDSSGSSGAQAGGNPGASGGGGTSVPLVAFVVGGLVLLLLMAKAKRKLEA